LHIDHALNEGSSMWIDLDPLARATTVSLTKSSCLSSPIQNRNTEPDSRAVSEVAFVRMVTQNVTLA
jgi:hypothetical protein